MQNPYTLPTTNGKTLQSKNSLSPELKKQSKHYDVNQNYYAPRENSYTSNKAKTTEKPGKVSDPRLFRDSNNGPIRGSTSK